MRIILANKFYFPQGGADKHVLQLEKMLQVRGHEVAIFAMDHPANYPSPWAKYFVSNVDFSRVRFGWSGLRTVGRTLHSFEAARKMEQLIRDFKPDVVHIHNIYHQISPSILPVIARHDIPIVQTLHDYALVSANYNLYAHGGICEHGRRGKYGEYISHRCIKNSLAASVLGAVDQWWHNRQRWYERYVGTFISPSRFLKDLILDWTGRMLNIQVRPNFIDKTPALIWPKDGSVLFVGRLSSEKGVSTLLRAAKKIPAKIKIVGTGPEESRLKNLAAELETTKVDWLGYKTGDELDQLMARAAVLVVPSEWYENNPLVVIEAMAKGTPVVASRIGGLPEMVEDGINGRLFAAGQDEALAAAVNQVISQPAVHQAMATAAVKTASKYSADDYLGYLENIYATARTR